MDSTTAPTKLSLSPKNILPTGKTATNPNAKGFVTNLRKDHVVVDPAGSAFTVAKGEKSVTGQMSGSTGSGSLYNSVYNKREKGSDPESAIISTEFAKEENNYGRPSTTGNADGSIKTTEAVFNDTLAKGAGNDKFLVIHAVGPTYSEGGDVATFEANLKATFASILKEWQKNAPDKALDLPLISGGLFGGKALGEAFYDTYLKALDAAINEAKPSLTQSQVDRIGICPYELNAKDGVDETNSLNNAMGRHQQQSQGISPQQPTPAAASTTEQSTAAAAAPTPPAPTPALKIFAADSPEAAEIPAPLIRNTNIKGDFVENPSTENLTTTQAKYEPKDDAVEKAAFRETLTKSLSANIAAWQKDQPLNLQFASEGNRGALSAQEYSTLYLTAVEDAMQQNALTAAQAKQVNICPSTEEDLAALSGAAPKEADIQAHQQLVSTVCDRSFNISKDRPGLAEQFALANKTSSLEGWQHFLDSTKATTEQDTSFGIFHDLVSQAISSKQPEADKLAFVKNAAKAFSFLGNKTPETSKFAESQNLTTALTDLAEASQKNVEFSKIVSSNQTALNSKITKISEEVQNEIVAASALDQTQSATPDADGKTPAASTTKKSTGKDAIDAQTANTAKAAKSIAVGAVTIAGMATASVFFPPIGVLIIVAAVLWYTNRKNKKDNQKTGEEEHSLLPADPDAAFTVEQFAAMKRQEASERKALQAAQDAASEEAEVTKETTTPSSATATQNAHTEMNATLTEAEGLIEGATGKLAKAHASSLGLGTDSSKPLGAEATAPLKNAGEITDEDVAKALSVIDNIDDGLESENKKTPTPVPHSKPVTTEIAEDVSKAAAAPTAAKATEATATIASSLDLTTANPKGPQPEAALSTVAIPDAAAAVSSTAKDETVATTDSKTPIAIADSKAPQVATAATAGSAAPNTTDSQGDWLQKFKKRPTKRAAAASLSAVARVKEAAENPVDHTH